MFILDVHAESLAPRLSAVADMLAHYNLSEYEFSARENAPPVHANWKLMLEVGLESYHFPFVHGQTLAANLTGAPNPPPGNGSWTVSVEPRSRPLEVQSTDPAELTKADRSTTFTFGIFPCTVFNIDVDNVVWFTLLPSSTDRTESIFGSAARTAEHVRILGEDKPTTHES